LTKFVIWISDELFLKKNNQEGNCWRSYRGNYYLDEPQFADQWTWTGNKMIPQLHDHLHVSPKKLLHEVF
jgi:hypothetical protein